MAQRVVPRGDPMPFLIESATDVTATTAFGGYETYADVLNTLPVVNLGAGLIPFQIGDGGAGLLIQFFGKGQDGGQAQAILERLEETQLRGVAEQNLIRQFGFNPLVAVDLTLGKKLGVAGGLITETHRYVDTIAAVASGNGDRTLGLTGFKVQGPAAPDEGVVSMLVDGLCSGWYAMRLRCASNCTAINFRHAAIPLAA